MRTVNISEEIHQELQYVSAATGKNMSEISENWIKTGLESLDPTVKKAIEVIKKARQ